MSQSGKVSPQKHHVFLKPMVFHVLFFGGEALNFHNAFVGPGRIEHRPGSTTELFKATVFLEHSWATNRIWPQATTKDSRFLSGQLQDSYNWNILTEPDRNVHETIDVLQKGKTPRWSYGTGPSKTFCRDCIILSFVKEIVSPICMGVSNPWRYPQTIHFFGFSTK